MTVKIMIGDVREQLRTLAADSVHCCVTSPPYWGLRDYGVDGQIGLEASPAEFIAVMVDVFEEVRRVLRPDGTCFINMGDSYANDGKWGGSTGGKHANALHGDSGIGRNKVKTGLKPKDLVMMPHRLAIALQDAGWWVRQDIVWSKPNPMPESVRDRCTKSHEYIFLLTKSANYFYDADAIKEPAQGLTGQAAHFSRTGAVSEHVIPGQSAAQHRPRGVGFGHGTDAAARRRGRVVAADMIDAAASARLGRGTGIPAFRNKRSVWVMATHSFAEAHFATFPPELPENCIRAGCPPGGTVLDPFFGAGTTGLVADRLQRDCIGIELNPAYAEIARRRIHNESSLFSEIEVTA